VCITRCGYRQESNALSSALYPAVVICVQVTFSCCYVPCTVIESALKVLALESKHRGQPVPGEFVAPVASASGSLLNYFSPTRSPYYTVALAACFALAWVCDVEQHDLWLILFIPAFVVAVMTLWLSFDAKNVLSEAEHAEQLRFARSTSISSAVLSLAFAGAHIAWKGQEQSFFYWTFALCSVQIVIFVVFSWALNQEGSLPGSNRNYVQLTLLTSAFLVDTATNLALASGEKGEAATHHVWTARALGMLWLLCVAFWVMTLRKVISIYRPGLSEVRAQDHSSSP